MSARRRTYSRDNPCPACSGWPTLPQGKGVRCYGFFAASARSFFCTREETAGRAPFNDGANAWKHRLYGPCPCGGIHGEALPDGAPPWRPHLTVVEPEPEPLDPATLDAVYRRYLGLSPLRPEHVEHLAGRDTADLAIARARHYGSLPLGYTAAGKLVEALILDFGVTTLARVPGFYINRRSGKLNTHTATEKDDAIVIPAWNEHGQITALVRMRTRGEAAKYRTFHRGGADFYTITGPDWQPGDVRRLWIVEGTHKAHVAAYQSGQRILGLPGAHLSDAHTAAIAAMAPDEVIESLDADKFIKKDVARQQDRIHTQLTHAGLTVAAAVWEIEDGKGMDDLFAVGRAIPRLRMVAHRPEVTARTPEPAPIVSAAAGRPLAEVQRETERTIGDFIQHRRRYKGRVKVIAAPAGVGKSTAAARAVHGFGVVARIGVATKAKAQEFADTYPGHIRAVEARNPENCQNFAAVEAARAKGHDVSDLVCERCPFLQDCRDTAGRYYQQFRQLGTLVGTSEMLYSSAFLKQGEVVIADDAALERVLIDLATISAPDALHLAAVIQPGPVRELLTVVQRAIDAERERAGGGFSLPLIGPYAWDALARAAGSAGRLLALIDASPPADDLLPAPADGQTLTADDINAAPPAVLSKLVHGLTVERAAFASGNDFNSGFSLHPGGLEVRALRPPLWNRKEDKPVLADKAVLVLDATPLLPLVEHFADGLTFEPLYAPTVTLPANVSVTQIADRFHGKTSVNRTYTREDGTEYRPGKEALLTSLAGARADYPGDREAVICAKALKPDVEAAGLPDERVLTFYGNRGLNSIEDADVLHVLGRPQAPDWTALQLAHVIHRGEAPIAAHLAMKLEPYTGYRAPDGEGRAIAVLDFVDERVSAIFRQHREAELIQSIHRARLFRVSDAQVGFFEPAAQGVARSAGERRRVRVVLHSAQPVPGLRVDDLVYDAPPTSLNEQRQTAATARILAARNALAAEGVPVTVNAIKRLVGSRKDVIARVLASESDELIRPVTTVIRHRFTNGGDRADQFSAGTPSNGRIRTDQFPSGQSADMAGLPPTPPTGPARRAAVNARSP